MTVNEALMRARLALPYVKEGKRSMGKDFGYLNPIIELAECFEVLDAEGKKGNLPREWNRIGG